MAIGRRAFARAAAALAAAVADRLIATVARLEQLVDVRELRGLLQAG